MILNGQEALSGIFAIIMPGSILIFNQPNHWQVLHKHFNQQNGFI